MPRASARRTTLSYSVAVRLRLSCRSRGSDVRGRPILFLPWQSACVLEFGDHFLPVPNETVCPRQTDISLPSPPLYSPTSLTSIATLGISQTFPSCASLS